ncbi:hypothetical protein [Neisseria gonorrhoeae]|uniref:hypothetical protein n=1 Tax=Neisseria gonorrhoeae TaxID=485 RepID=UPI0021A59454|nr:hypothetical protein [Neisseria gonorrhoeae]UWT12619.1 hypothetical protein NC849_07830 [Neisseria gonorrhoeae]
MGKIADFAVAGGLENDLPLISGRMKNKKQPAQAVLVCINLNPNSYPSSPAQGLYFRRGVWERSGLQQVWRLQAVLKAARE